MVFFGREKDGSGTLLKVFLVCETICCWILEVRCNSAGAPYSACRAMMPLHGVDALKTTAPYQILVAHSKINATETLAGGPSFIGFLLMAKPTLFTEHRGAKPIGTFNKVEGTQLVDCHNEQSSAVTHKRAQNFRDVVMEWSPPRNFQGRVTFKATFVKSYKQFWMDVESSPVTII